VGLVLDWKKKLGYAHDPFEKKIMRPAHLYIVGFEKEQEAFNLFLIKNNQLATLSGDEGTGKTTFLAWALDVLKGDYAANYVDAKKANKQVQLIDTFLASNTSMLTRRFALKKPADEKYKKLLAQLEKKPHMLLIDHAGSLTNEGVALLLDVIQKTRTHLLLADTKEGIKGLDLADVKLKLSTPSYTDDELTSILRKRIEGAGSVGTFPFDESELKKLVKASAGNPARLLENARERAIELSLKVTSRPEHQEPRHEPSVPQGEIKKFGFFNIKIDRGEAPVNPTTRPPSAPQRQERPLEEMPDLPSAEEEMLMRIVGDDDTEEIIVEDVSAGKTRGTTKIDKEIEKIAGKKKK